MQRSTQAALAQEILQPGPVLIGRRANFLNHDRLQDFALQRIISPLLRGNFSSHNFAPLAVDLDRERVKSPHAKILPRAAPQQEQEQQDDSCCDGRKDDGQQ